MADPWGSWCAEQTPVSWQDPSQVCGFAFDVQGPGVSRRSSEGCSRESNDGVEDIDCALMYALEFCDCARDGCFATIERVVEVGLELAEDGASLQGRLWWENANAAPQVEFVRMP
jgi:hypothetical protein